MTGRNTEQGFLPDEPSLDEMLKRIGLPGYGGATDASKPMEDMRAKAAKDLKRNYVQLFSTPAGRMILEDILDASVRRAFAHPGGNVPMDVQTAYVLERMGQNGLAAYILKMIHDGKNVPAPGSKKAKKAA